LGSKIALGVVSDEFIIGVPTAQLLTSWATAQRPSGCTTTARTGIENRQAIAASSQQQRLHSMKGLAGVKPLGTAVILGRMNGGTAERTVTGRTLTPLAGHGDLETFIPDPIYRPALTCPDRPARSKSVGPRMGH
jgi:hypothetical protein